MSALPPEGMSTPKGVLGASSSGFGNSNRLADGTRTLVEYRLAIGVVAFSSASINSGLGRLVFATFF